jgi:hypothetical protein
VDGRWVDGLKGIHWGGGAGNLVGGVGSEKKGTGMDAKVCLGLRASDSQAKISMNKDQWWKVYDARLCSHYVVIKQGKEGRGGRV